MFDGGSRGWPLLKIKTPFMEIRIRLAILPGNFGCNYFNSRSALDRRALQKCCE